MVDWFAPGYKAGGPIQSCVNFAFAMKNDFDIYVLTTDTDHGETEPYQNIVSNKWIKSNNGISIFYARKKELTLKQLMRTMIDANADYVYLNHLFSPHFVVYPLWLKYIGKLKSKIVLCPRGALYDSALSVKPYKKKPFIQLFKWMGMKKQIIFHATNDREKKAIERFFPNSKIIIADNLPNTDQPVFESCEKRIGTLKCIFIARIFPIKNLLFILNFLEHIKENINFTIIGPIEDAGYWDECKKKIEQLPSNIHVNYLGPKRNDELPEILKEHHLFVLPTTGENFGHSIFESFLCGRPVLISDQTPWLQLSNKKVGWDLSLNEPNEFANVIKKTANWDQNCFDEWAHSAWQYARSFISNPALHSQYLQLFS